MPVVHQRINKDGYFSGIRFSSMKKTVEDEEEMKKSFFSFEEIKLRIVILWPNSLTVYIAKILL